jgi:PAS domain S-box-containing protein
LGVGGWLVCIPQKTATHTPLTRERLSAVAYRRYGFAIAIALAAAALTLTTPILLARPYIPSLLAVFVAAWVAGFRPALFCLGLSLPIIVTARATMAGRPWRPLDTIAAISFVVFGVLVASLARAIAQSQRDARRQRARLEAMFGQAAAGLGLTDCDGRFTRVNRRLIELVGQSGHATLSLNCADLTSADDRTRTIRAIHEICAGEIAEFSADSRYCRADGSIVWLHVSIAPLRDENEVIDGLIVIVEDITDRRQAEDALRLADQQKDDFLALLSHELRNPLAPIRTAVQLLKMRGNGDADGQRLHGVIDRQVQHLVRLVDDLLDVSRVLRGKVDLNPDTIDLASVIAIAVETVRPLVDAQRQELNVHVPEHALAVHGDQVRLAQVIGNLLNNASKYTPRGGTITLGASEESGNVVVRVADTGAGIPAEILPTIFEPFVQADRSLQRAQGGLGIGLTLVKKIVDLHGGSVSASSPGPGQGSEFVVRLPSVRATALRVDNAPSSQGPASAARRRILVVDDNTDAADSLDMLLTSLGHEVAVARDGLDAVARTLNWRPDVVLLDIGLPGMSGYDVASELKRTLETPPTLIAITGYGQASDRQRAIAAGFDEHLVKPVDTTVLRTILDRAAITRTT